MEQYGEPTEDINHLLHARRDEFVPIEDVTVGRVCPTESNGAYGNDYIYFAARSMPLPTQGGLDLYAMSYLGTASFAHSNKAFDALLTSSQLGPGRTMLAAPLGLAESWLRKHSIEEFGFGTKGGYGYSAVLSYNSGDIDGDGRHDFVFESRLVLSGRGYADAGPAPRRAMFSQGSLIAYEQGALSRYRWSGNELERIGRVELRAPVHSNVPYVVLPLPEGRIAVRTANGMDVYTLDRNGIAYFASVNGLAPGEIQTGAFGDFTGDGGTDAWIAQVATPTPYPNKRDQIVLIRMSDIAPGDNRLEDIAWFTIRGSARYSDYDGIGTTLSPVAGDLTGDGTPDLSFTGHRHMNEAGALYVHPGEALVRGSSRNITDARVIKILGAPMSQLAPPFHHWDATDLTGDGHDDVVVPADNDLCSGLNAGAIYTLSGAKIIAEWRRRSIGGTE